MGKSDRVKASTKKYGRRRFYGNRFTRKIAEEMEGEEVEQQQQQQPQNTPIHQ